MNRDDSNTDNRNVRNLNNRYTGCLWSLESSVLIFDLDDEEVVVVFAVEEEADGADDAASSSPPDRLENA